MTNSRSDNIPLPDGYTSWLDYAVDTLDTRALEICNLFDNIPAPERAQIIDAARRELQELRARVDIASKMRP